MKKQILMLIIGILIGAIITTGVFLVLKGNAGWQGDKMNMRGGEPPIMDGNVTGGEYGGSKENRRQDNNGSTNTDNTDINET